MSGKTILLYCRQKNWNFCSGDKKHKIWNFVDFPIVNNQKKIVNKKIKFLSPPVPRLPLFLILQIPYLCPGRHTLALHVASDERVDVALQRLHATEHVAHSVQLGGTNINLFIIIVFMKKYFETKFTYCCNIIVYFSYSETLKM